MSQATTQHEEQLLKGRVAFITGGSRGIGLAVVRRFLQSAARYVMYFSRKKSTNHDELEALAKQQNAVLVHYEGSVDDEAAVHAAVSQAAKDAGGLDIVVNNAGITNDKFIIGMNKDDWQRVLDVNLNGAFYAGKAAVTLMLKQRRGSIINMSSIVGITGNPGQTNYSASKAGLIGFTKSLAREVAKRSVRVNAIAPGFIETEMTDVIQDQYKEQIMSHIPMQRIGTADEIADVCVFLASDMSRYITGQVIAVAGGMGV